MHSNSFCGFQGTPTKNFIMEMIQNRPITFFPPIKNLQQAVAFGNVRLAKVYLEKGERFDGDEWTETIFNPINWKVRKEMLTLLFEHGLVVKNVRNNLGENFLHVALCSDIRNKDIVEIAEMLINCGVSVNDLAGSGHSPLYYSTLKCKNAELVSLLIEKGADVNVKNNTGWSMLHLAAIYSTPKIMDVFLSNNLDINGKCQFGNTPLHQACIHNNAEAVRLLLR